VVTAAGHHPALRARLEARRTELEQEITIRLHALPGPEGIAVPEYRDGSRAAVPAAVEYALEAIEHSEEGVGPPPSTLLAHARLAARVGVPLDAVLRRYFAGYVLLANVLLQEAEAAGLKNPSIQALLRSLGVVFDGLIAALTEEHGREARERGRLSPSRRLADRVERLLAGEMLDISQYGYVLDGHHIGVVCAGSGAEEAVRTLAATLDRSCLVVPRGEASTWAWLGGRPALSREDFVERLKAIWPRRLPAAFGEPAQGLSGWRLTHRQAQAALPTARCGPVHYAEVALLASAMRDETLVRSLHNLFLVPIRDGRDEGRASLETLKAYFAAQRNISSAAAALGVSRRTVASRLRRIEERLDRLLATCVAALEWPSHC
jgi:hypothetical protein